MNKARAMKYAARVVLLLMVLSLAACSGPQPYQSPILLQAREHNQRGVDAESRGQHPRARAEFTAALRKSASVEDNEGTVTALVNLARLARRDGEAARGRELITQAASKVSSGTALAGEVAFELALQQLAADESGDAERSARQALAIAATPARHNLLARILWRQARANEAAAEARSALGSVDDDADPAEAANACRLLAEIAAAAGEGARAEDQYRRALELDRRAGLSGRIASDLRGLFALAVTAGRTQEASGLLYRAFEVSLNGGDLPAALTDLERLAALYRQGGDAERAAKIDAQRQELQRSAAAPPE
jgi:tetratricopeptide (TPR) repeat protein